ncbi:MAG: proton-conducting transporter membrane subunit [Sandaracinaceae bacterium]
MTDAIYLLPLAGPLILALAALAGTAEPGPYPRHAKRVVGAATLVTLVVSIVSAVILVALGPGTSPTLGVAPLGLSVRLDALSAIVFGLVSFVGVLVARFSFAYLEGDARHGAFLGRLSLTLSAVSLLVLSGNLLHLAIAWVATSLALHRLLLFYPQRWRAFVAARKKFIVARIGDVALLTAFLLLYVGFGALDVVEVGRLAAAGGPTVDAAAVLIAIAAALKSAQFPTHGWLVEVMETPTPVSALLHAGIVNAGGFLVLRLSGVMVESSAALLLLTVIGGATALIASAVMLTQSSVKASLAYSTVAQMGFMLLQCGLGAFSSAVLHLVAHSLYKAHAFLASGSAVEMVSAKWRGQPAAAPTPLLGFVAVVVALGVFALTAALFGVTPSREPAIVLLGAVLALALAHLILRASSALRTPAFVARMVLAATALSVSYFALQAGTHALVADVVAEADPLFGLPSLAAPLVLLGFVGLAVGQWMVTGPLGGPFVRALYVHARNGFYANALFDRWLGTLRPRA